MIKIEEIARPYARAAFQWATEKNHITQWHTMLSALAALVSSAKIWHALKSPHYSSFDKVQLLLDLTQDILDESGKNFLQLLAENHRLNALGEIYRQFVLLQEAAASVIEAEVTTVKPLSAELTARLVTALEQRTGAKIQLHPRVDETLIGGIQIRLGDEIIDSSISGQLNRLAQHLQLKENVCL